MFDNENAALPSRSGRGMGRGRGRGRGRRWMGDYSLIDVRLVEPALLAFLNSESLHGYGLLDKLESLGLGSVNPSVIYRILRDYEEIGLVQSNWNKESTQGPPRRVYSLTDAGEEALQRAIDSLNDTITKINKITNLVNKVSD